MVCHSLVKCYNYFTVVFVVKLWTKNVTTVNPAKICQVKTIDRPSYMKKILKKMLVYVTMPSKI